MKTITRRQALIGAMCSATGRAAAAPPVIETHVHLFDPDRVPYAPGAPYKPSAYPLEAHLKLVAAAGLTHSVIVHPEPYQDDHRYLEYCFAHEPGPGYFKGTCLFDPFRDDTPGRLRALVERWPKRIVAMRIHEVNMTPEAAGPIRNRDMKHPRMLACWKTLAGLGVGIQMHFIPGQASNIHSLAAKFPDTTVILDHMGRPADGTAEEYSQVLKLAELPRVVMKYSNWAAYEGDLKLLTRRIYDAFGPDRMIWGMLGNTLADYRKQSQRFDELLAFASEADRAKIRGGNAQRLFFGYLLVTSGATGIARTPEVPRAASGVFCAAVRGTTGIIAQPEGDITSVEIQDNRPAEARRLGLGARRPCAILRGSPVARCLRSEVRSFCLPGIRAARR